MRMILTVSLLATVLVFKACGDGPGPDVPKPRVALIFSDVTSSLLESEKEQVSSVTANVIDTFLPGTEYYVFPIQMEPQRLQPLDHDTIVVDAAPGINQAVRTQRRDKLKKEIDTLYALIKPAKAQPTRYGRPDNHSCILYTLDFADKFFRQFNPALNDLELIYVSDMVEECNTTPMHQRNQACTKYSYDCLV